MGGYRIGLALGAGSARGWAHIGVLRALTEAGIHPDVIAGTSVGALVGGCYVAGELDALEEFARELTRRKVLGFLDIFGAWDPSLAVVMAAALAVSSAGYACPCRSCRSFGVTDAAGHALVG